MIQSNASCRRRCRCDRDWRRSGRVRPFRRLIAQQGYRVQLFERERFPAVSHRRIADPRDLLGAQAAQHARQDEGQPLRQEVQRAVRQRQRQAVGAVLLLGQQAARVLADVAGGAQRVRSDDARQRPRARRRRARRRARAGCAVRGRAGRRRARFRNDDGATREVRAKVVVDASGQSGAVA